MFGPWDPIYCGRITGIGESDIELTTWIGFPPQIQTVRLVVFHESKYLLLLGPYLTGTVAICGISRAISLPFIPEGPVVDCFLEVKHDFDGANDGLATLRMIELDSNPLRYFVD